jgi:Ca2+-binding RTX toxin-like protein
MTVQEDREQLFLELINRARLDPLAEGALQGVANLSTGTGMTITGAALQVLAYNAKLYQASRAHTLDMIAHNFFDHPGSNGSDPSIRMAAAGYGIVFANGTQDFGSGENLEFRGSGGAIDANAEVYLEHRDLFKSNDHRSNILDPDYKELGVYAQTTTGFQGAANALLTTHGYGYRPAAGVFVTGVNYTDTDNNDFYSIGESAAGRTVQLFKGGLLLGTSTTANAGGYQVVTTNSGAVEIVFSGGGLSGERAASFTLGTLNIKVDLTDNSTIETNVSTTLTRSTQNLTLLSIDNVSGTGNGVDNIIKGNKGNNILDGAGGNDTLIGGPGSDTLIGGTGNDILSGGVGTNDKAVFTDVMANYTFTFDGPSLTYTVTGVGGEVDTVTGVESFEFSDGTRMAAQLPLVPPPTKPSVAVAIATPGQAEGNSGTTVYSFNVTLSAAAATTQTVNFVAAGSGVNAANVADFSGAMSGVVTFLAGETSKIIQISVKGDTTLESNETFTLTLSGQSAGVVLGASTAQAIIANDDVPGPKIINGTALADVLVGTAGIDHIFGHNSNDTLTGGASADILDGGDGIDTVSYISSSAGVTIDLDNNTSAGGDATGDTIVDIENITGSGHDDTITGDDEAQTLKGGSGDDHLFGLDGNDILDGGTGADALDGGNQTDTVNYATSNLAVNVDLLTNVNTGGFAQGDTLFNIENLSGSGFDDHLTGDGLANTLIGGNGNDQLVGGLGNDLLNGGKGADHLDGGDGNDTASYRSSSVGVSVNLSTGLGSGGEAQGDMLLSIENIYGSNANDTLTGSTADNFLFGYYGNDSISGGAGLDTVDGGLGNDILDGGTGNDNYTGGAGHDTFKFSNLNSGSDTITDFSTVDDRIELGAVYGVSLADLVFSGQGTTQVTVTGFDTTASIVVKGASAMILDASDFLFA